MSQVLLEAKALKKSFRVWSGLFSKKREVVNGVSLVVNEGEIVCLLGPNGAGKSTTMKMLSGFITPDEGAVIFNGKDVTNMPMYQRCNSGLGYMAQEHTLFKNLTVEQNLIGVMQLLGYSRNEIQTRCEEMMELFDLKRIRHTKASGLSGGEKRRLEVARAMTKKPKLIILDEPFAGVDPKITQKIQELVVNLRERMGVAILITDHSVPPLREISDRGYVIDNGVVIFDGGMNELINDPQVRDTYLGDKTFPLDIAQNDYRGQVPLHTETTQKNQADTPHMTFAHGSLEQNDSVQSAQMDKYQQVAGDEFEKPQPFELSASVQRNNTNAGNFDQPPASNEVLSSFMDRKPDNSPPSDMNSAEVVAPTFPGRITPQRRDSVPQSDPVSDPADTTDEGDRSPVRPIRRKP